MAAFPVLRRDLNTKTAPDPQVQGPLLQTWTPTAGCSVRGSPEQGGHGPENSWGLRAPPKCHSSDPRACVPEGLQRFPQAPPPAFHLHWEGLQGPLKGRVPPSLQAKISLVTNASSLNPSPGEMCQNRNFFFMYRLWYKLGFLYLDSCLIIGLENTCL